MNAPIRSEDTYLPPPPPPPERPGERRHAVQEGETLTGIATDHRTTLQAILDINPQVRDPGLLNAGEVLRMPDVQVAPEVSRTVDAVLAPGATADQRNEANARVQDHVDRVGGVSDRGIAPGALPAQAHALLSEAGLPTIPAEVVASVDRALGPDASLEARTAGYGTVQAYVDQVGGISDQGITAQALPARAADLLRESGQDVALRGDVIRAVDNAMAPDASQADRDAGYRTVQQYVDRVGGIGDAGIVADALPGKAAQLLIDADNRGLAFDPEVVGVVDQVIAPNATDRDRLAGYEATQAYVDDVGGIGDSGVTRDYLPLNAIEQLRTRGIAVNTEVADDASADQIVVAAEGGATPEEQAQILKEGYAGASPSVRTQLLADPRTQGLVRDIAADATRHLDTPPEDFGGGDAVPALRTMEALERITRDMDPALAAAVLDASVPAMVRYRSNDYGGPISLEGMALLQQVTDRVAGTPAGDAAIQRIADETGFYQMGSALNHAAQGGSPAYALALGNPNNEAVDGVMSFAQGTLKDDIEAYTQHTAELNWLVANHGDSMTPEQLDQAIRDYIAEKGAGWERTTNDLKAKVAEDGVALLGQIEALQAAGGHDDALRTLLDDPNTQFALSTALGAHPDAASDQSLRVASILAKSSDGGRKLLGMVADAHIKAQVLPELQHYNPADPASVQRVQTALSRLGTADMASALGVDQTRLDKAVQSLSASLQAPGATQADFDSAMSRLNRDLDGVGFGKESAAGQLFRSVGVGLAGVGLAYSLEKLGQDPSNALNWAKATSDTIGVYQKTSEIVFARGAGGTATRFAASRLAQGIAGGLGAAVDGAFAIQAFANGDPTSGALYSLAAGGGALATASSVGAIGAWGGPVGIGIAALAAVGLMQWSKVKEANQYQTETSQRFLEHAGFEPEVAGALVDQSGDGHSPVPLLVAYAEGKGYDMANAQHRQQFVDWLNAMPADQLDHVRNWLNNVSDELGGDVERLGDDRTVVMPTTTITTQGGIATVWDTPDTVGELDALMQEYGATPLPLA